MCANKGLVYLLCSAGYSGALPATHHQNKTTRVALPEALRALAGQVRVRVTALPGLDAPAFAAAGWACLTLGRLGWIWNGRSGSGIGGGPPGTKKILDQICYYFNAPPPIPMAKITKRKTAKNLTKITKKSS